MEVLGEWRQHEGSTDVLREQPPKSPSSLYSPYEYTHFANSHSIRILTLHPGVEPAPLEGTLSVEDLHANPSYEAISYVWGQEGRCSSLVCSDAAVSSSSSSFSSSLGQSSFSQEQDRPRALPLTQSVHDALSRVRHPHSPRRIWADQVCINQADVAERSSQVRLMNAIYRGAEQVLVWLGRDTERMADQAVAMVEHLDKVFRDEELHREFRRQHSEELARQSAGPWVPLSKLTQLSWVGEDPLPDISHGSKWVRIFLLTDVLSSQFSRLWIVQEIGTLTPATLFWGNASLSWETLSYVAAVLNQQYHLLRTRFFIFTPNIRYLYQRFVETPPLSDPEQWIPRTDAKLTNSEYDEGEAVHRAGDDGGSICHSGEGDSDLDGEDQDEDGAYMYQQSRNRVNRSNFIYELHRARHLLSKDPRDQVYAFLGHFSLNRSGSHLLRDLRPDYELSVQQVYFDVAVRALQGCSLRSSNTGTGQGAGDQTGTGAGEVSDNALIILSACHHTHPLRRSAHLGKKKRRTTTTRDNPGRSSSSTNDHPLQTPSWVPDWRVLPVHLMANPSSPHRPAGSTQPQLHVDVETKTLHIRGRRVNSIARCSWTLQGRSFQFNAPKRTSRWQEQTKQQQEASSIMPLEVLWRSICGHDEGFNLDRPYQPRLNKSRTDSQTTTPTDSAFFALLQTLTNGCAGIQRTVPYATIPPSQWLSHGASYVVRPLPLWPNSSPVPPAIHEAAAAAAAPNDGGGNPFEWSHEATLVTRYRNFGVTQQGYYVIGPHVMGPGDVIVVLYGGKAAYVLREKKGEETGADADADEGSGDGAGAGGTREWTLLGECYVHGIMNGEILEDETCEEEVFSIR
jgi:hypothetical protein